MDTAMLLGGHFERGTEADERILNPRNAGLIAEIPEASAAQVDAAVGEAVAAFDRWSRTTPAERSALLLKLADRIEAQAEEYARLEAMNCGKPYHLVLNDEIPGGVDCYRFFAG